MSGIVHRLTALIETFAAVPGAMLRETLDLLRITETECISNDSLRELSAVTRQFVAEGFGEIAIEGVIAGPINPSEALCDEYRGEKFRLTIQKHSTPSWCYFLTLSGWERALQNEAFIASSKAVWVAADFEEFSSYRLRVSPWGNEKTHVPGGTDQFERPRRLVRDQTYANAPADIRPWLLTGPAKPSVVFDVWKAAATPKLTFALPFEIREIEKALHVVLKGPRSNPIPVTDGAITDTQSFGVLLEAAEWLYTPPREAEIKFTFLNYHLSLDWPQGESWPAALPRVLAGSLASAKDAFTYHLHAQASESLKSMADLRRSLQDDVTKVQQATRDLLTALWRDFAVAGIVLALRSPSAKDAISSEVLRYVTLGAALLLTLSLLITIGSTLRFNSLAAQARSEWKKRSYAFIPEADWESLVEKPLRSGRRVFWTVVCVVSLFYTLIVLYLVSIGLSHSPNSTVNEPKLAYFGELNQTRPTSSWSANSVSC